jgi:arylsulfatase A-like enzyme
MNQPQLPPIILLLLDSAGANRFSLYGYGRPTTPYLERLAPEAAVYRHCFAPAPWTIPSHTSLLTGLYPHEHGCNTGFDRLPPEALSLPEILQEQGYRTLGITSNLIVSGVTGLDRGFQEFYETTTLFQDPDFLEARVRYQLAKRQTEFTTNWKRTKFTVKFMWDNKYVTYPIKRVLDQLYYRYLGNVNKSSAFVTKRSMWQTKRLIKKYKNVPFFLFINLMETHWPYSAPAPYNRLFQKPDPKEYERLMDKKIRYRAFEEDLDLRRERSEFWGLCQDQEIAYTDSLIGQLRDFLVQQGLWDRVLFIVTSDHGEALGEHGLFGHIFSVYNELVHIPLIVKYPRDYGLTGDFRQLAQLHDLFATLCQVADSPRPAPLSSMSLLDETRDLALCAFLDNSQSLQVLERRLKKFNLHPCMLPGNALIRPDLWKLIRWQDGSEELYNLNQDFGESQNLAGSAALAAQQQELRRQLDELLASL